MTSKKIQKINPIHTDDSVNFQQLIIPGLEEFMAKLNQNTKNSEKSQSK